MSGCGGETGRSVPPTPSETGNAKGPRAREQRNMVCDLSGSLWVLCRYGTEKGQEEKLRDRRGDTAIISPREDGGWAHMVAVEVARKDPTPDIL